ncbi:MAG: TMEM175 family protein [Acidobacteriaceae bacterium]
MRVPFGKIEKDGFRLRGTESSRIDGFSDVVFGFSLTLIVVSSEVPRTYDQFHKILLGLVPFAICFGIFFSVWHAHYRFFRRYGVHDNATIWINCVLLFTVMFYAYPLKFLFTLIGTQATNIFSNPYQLRELMVVYGLGFTAIYYVIAVLYWNAWRQRRPLDLSPLETTITLSLMWDFLGVGSFGLLCCAIAYILPPDEAGNAPLCFFAIFIWKTVHGFVSARKIRAARARTRPEDLEQLPHDTELG